MPIYEFRCEECGTKLEALRRLGQGPEGLECPSCGSTALSQVFSAFAARGESSGSPGGGGGGCGAGSGFG